MTPHPEEVAACLVGQPGAAWLDTGSGRSGWSILAWNPRDVLTDPQTWPEAGRARHRPRAAGEAPFVGGVLGYLGYGIGSEVEPVPPSQPTPEPPLWLARYDGALCYRHHDCTWHPTGTDAVQAAGRELLARARRLAPPPPPPGARTSTVDQRVYERGVRRILEWIRAGDCYQVNLSRPVFVHGAGAPWPAYRRLRRAPATYGAYLELGGGLAVLCNSPELFVEVRGQLVASEPIKGTRPRDADPLADARMAAELRDSAKDRAELTMIVDLVRNDLGRVAQLGTVATGERTITAHPTVHHTSQRVTAKLRPDLDVWDLLAAAFPPGSVTGAPKVRACERIRDLEAHPRGVYCGAIGFVSDCGHAAFNVAIRTAVFAGCEARYHVGGGVVAASEPVAEWDETEAKGRALHAALVGPSGGRP